MSLENPVHELDPEVSRKIAAGEVIDRPNAIIRELMDNSIDSKPTSITVEITNGGIDKIRIIDDGCGMSKNDLLICAKPHTTSKISSELDLMNLSTLGFRGEALSSISAVCRLSIQSGGWKIKKNIIGNESIDQTSATKGTIIQTEGLFDNIPARRIFLKRPGSESVMCKNTFIEKSLPKPKIAFKFVSDGITKIELPIKSSLKDRFLDAYELSDSSNLFYEIKNQSKDFDENTKKANWKYTVVIGEPAISKPTKKDIGIFVNNRKISEYSLVQAVEYGCQGFFPNGTYPVACVFIDINPKLVDFNIHPAKKEVKFYDISDLHHSLSSSIKKFMLDYCKTNFDNDKTADFSVDFDFESPISQVSKIQEPVSTYQKHISYKAPSFPYETKTYSSDFRSKYLDVKNNNNSDTKNLAELAIQLSSNKSENEDYSALENSKIKFIGFALGTFLLAEKNNCLYILDQHAVHERILFDRIMTSQGKSQSLLLPYKIKTESKTQDNQLEKIKDELTRIGFKTSKIKDGEWEITSIPERWTGSEYELKSLILVKHTEPSEIIRSIAALTACKAAIKDGYVIDKDVATELVEKAFLLPDPHCPHGRPIYTVLSREQLFSLVKRT